MGRWPNLKEPRRFTEKIQLYKMLYRDELLFALVDKYRVREYVQSCGLGHTLNTLYGRYDDPRAIDFDSLPSQFVIKTTDGSGGDNILICRDKAALYWPKVVEQLHEWRNKSSVNAGREWAYTGITKSQYIVEEYLADSVSGASGLIDYKLFCFDGKPYCIQIDYDRFRGHKRVFVDVNFKELDVWCSYDVGSLAAVQGFAPSSEMIEIASILSASLPFVRVDLYRVDGRIYFGEMTLYPGSGYEPYRPDSFDFTLGEEFDVSKLYSYE